MAWLTRVTKPSADPPTSIRTTGVGFASSMSRIGAAFGTFIFPLILHWNLQFAVGSMAVVCVIGALVSQFFAPETRGRSLVDVTSATPS